MRVYLTQRLDLDLEMVVPRTGPRYDTGNKSPRVNFGIGHSILIVRINRTAGLALTMATHGSDHSYADGSGPRGAPAAGRRRS